MTDLIGETSTSAVATVMTEGEKKTGIDMQLQPRA